MRAFIALEVSEEVKANVADLEREIAEEGLALVKKEEMHITLQFLGEISEQRVEDAKLAMQKATFSRFAVNLRGVSYFTPNFLKVIFVKVQEGSSELQGLYSRLSSELRLAGVPFEIESYTPHLTVARVRFVKDRAAIMGKIERNAEREFGSFTADAIVLKQSVSQPGGHVYTDLYEQKAGG